MWFATRFGVASYDGWHWTRYGVGDGLPIADQRRVMSDDAGRIWVVGDYGRAAVLENGDWTTLPTFETPGTDFGPAAEIVPRSDGVLLLVAPKTGGAMYLTDDVWHTLHRPDECGERVYDIASDGRRAYIATDAGVFTVDPEHPEAGAQYLDFTPRRKVVSVSFDRPTETLWVAGPDFIGKVMHGRFELVRDDMMFELLDAFDYLVCEPDGLGGLYVGNPIALYRCDETGCEAMGKSNGLAADEVTALHRDREGNMWVASLRGVSKIVSLRFANYTSEHGLAENEVTAVLERRDGGFVLGHRSSFTFMNGDVDILPLPRKVGARVLDLAEDDSGNVWAAISAYGLASIDRSGEIAWHTSDDGLDENATSVLVARDGRIWATTTMNTFIEQDGKFRERPGGVKFGPGNAGYLRRLFEGRDATIYAASSDGLYEMRGGETTRIKTGLSGPAQHVYAFWEDVDGTLWLGTRLGLYVSDGVEVKKVVEPGPRIDRPVYFIVADQRNFLWFGTDNGVMKWDGADLEHLTIEDGLVGRETNRAASVLDSRGRLWFGMDRGVTVYRPQLDSPRHVPPILELAGVEVNGEIHPLDSDLNLRPGQNTLSFRFRAMSYADESKVQFQGWLEGFDDEWIEPLNAPNREIRYTNVPPGSYTFHLRAAGADGTWSETVSSSAIAIDAPIWKKPWFIALLVAAAALAVFGVVGYVSQRRYARRLETEVRERVEELRKIEAELERSRRIETLGGLAGGIAHDFNNLLTIMLGNLSLLDEEAKSSATGGRDYVRDATAAANRARALTQQLLTFSRGGAPVKRPGSIVDVIEESTEFVVSGSQIRCEIDLPDELHVVDIDAGQMSQVLNNLLLNAKQAMHESGVVRITGRNHMSSPHPGLEPGRYAEIAIQDEGRGIPQDDLDKVFDPYFSTKDDGSGLGLTTAYSIVKRHEGLLIVESARGSGTVCRIFLPASQDEAIAASVEQPVPSAGAGHILVMDDEDAIRELVGKMLKKEGHLVEFARDGNEAISLYQKRFDKGRSFDVVIMDLTIHGGMGGKETLEHLKEIDPGVNALVASGYSNDATIANFKEFGFRGRVGKPFSAIELNRVVAETLAASEGHSDTAS
jgi:signal transduction histidine kinase/ligand-binding sensor domain-containing protein/CheY-like chemotaxis protein